jgi:hypothetical protein
LFSLVKVYRYLILHVSTFTIVCICEFTSICVWSRILESMPLFEILRTVYLWKKWTRAMFGLYQQRMLVHNLCPQETGLSCALRGAEIYRQSWGNKWGTSSWIEHRKKAMKSRLLKDQSPEMSLNHKKIISRGAYAWRGICF